MFLPELKTQSGARKRASWLPDPGVWAYVRDALDKGFNLEVDQLPEHWIPLTIVGTLEWIVVCRWWIFRNTGIYESDEPYKFIFEYEGYEFDPDRLMIFREEPDRHKFAARMETPGLEPKEKSEALPFLKHDIFETWMRNEHDMTPEEAEQFIPPRQFLEIAMWSTFMWVLDTYGRDWIYMQDELIAHVYDWKVAFYSKWDNMLLDPNYMTCTNREISTCRYCNEKLWCVKGTEVNQKWQFVCNNCLMVMATESHHHLDKLDRRLHEPSCPHWRGANGHSGSCDSTCPHSGMNPEKVWQRMEDHGSRRVEAYRNIVQELGGRHPLQAAGFGLADLVGHFNNQVEGKDRPALEDKE